MIGTVLKHRYEVLEKVGEGSLFTVYRCDDTIDNRPVAAKVLLPQYASNRMFAERMLVESQAMVGMSHPGIVEVYDCGEESGTYYTILEYVRGVDLKERIRRSAPFSLTTVIDVGLAICDVLDHAHRKGFVHGDLRPGNILVSPEGHIKLADFWVSSAVASAQSIRTQAMMRSVHYMAPEVAEGKPATPTSDVYSLGVILFELLTASLPFDGDTPIAIALKHAKDAPPSIRTLNPGTPKPLEALVFRALQKQPNDRFRSAKAMFNDLRSVRDALNLQRPVLTPEPPEAKSAPAPPPTPEPPAAEPETQTAPTVAQRPAEDKTEVIPAARRPERVEPPREKHIAEPMYESAARVEFEEDERPPAFLSAIRTTLLIVLGIIVTAMLAMVIWAMTGPPDVKIPDFVGKTLEQAQSIASSKRLQVQVRTEQFNEEYPAGTVYYMNPPAGRSIKAGKTVELWLSRGSKYAKVPDVKTLALEDAKARILDAGLNVGEVTQDFDDKIPAGNIVKQTPGPGTQIERGEAVNLVFSLGPKIEGSTFSQEQYSAGGQSRTFKVKLKVPPGPENQKVEIIVQDEYGETSAYSDVMHPGDPLDQSVTGVGDKVTIRVYIDGKLVKEDRRWK